MAWERQESQTTKFLDLFRYLLIFTATVFAVFLIWKQNRILAFIESIPILVVMFNLFGFLTLPAYSHTPEIFKLMAKAFIPFLHKHIFSVLDAFSLRGHGKAKADIPDKDILKKDHVATGAATSAQIKNLSDEYLPDNIISDIKDDHPALPENKQLAQQIRQLIFLATEALYLEQFSDMAMFVKSLSGDKSDGDLLCAYVSIRIASQLAEPPGDANITNAIEQIQIAENHSNRSGFSAILNLHRELAEIHWQKRQTEILRGKLALKKDKYSYDGAIYELQRNSKSPMSMEDRAKFKELAEEIADLDRQIQEQELEALKMSDSEMYKCMKKHMEIQALQDELKTRKEFENANELKGLMEIIEKQLLVLHPKSSEPDVTEVFSK